MKLTIWGARGSIPAPMTTAELRQRLRETVLLSDYHLISTVLPVGILPVWNCV
jgi:hypothetical protein